MDYRMLLLSLSVASLIIVGLALDNSSVALMASLLAIATAVVVPVMGLVMVAFLAPLVGVPVLPYPGLIAVLVGAVLLGSIFRLPIDRPRIIVTPLALVVAGFTLYVFVQQIPAMATGYVGASELVGSMFLRIVTGVAAIAAAALVLRDRSPYPVLGATLVASVMAALLAIAMQDNADLSGPLANLVAVPEDGVRPSGPFQNPNYFGWFTATSMVITAGLMVAWPRPRVRGTLVIVTLVLAGGLLVAQSRGSLAALSAGLIALAFARSRKAGMIALAVCLVVGASMYPFLVERRLTDSIGSVSPHALVQIAASDARRLDAVMQGPELFATSPLFGIGLGQYPQQTGTYSHNWYMSLLAEHGLVGVVLWFFFLAGIAIRLRLRDAEPRSIGFAVLGVFAAACLFLEPPKETQGSVSTALVITAALVARWQADRLGHGPAGGLPDEGGS
jgi:hypothetical protein